MVPVLVADRHAVEQEGIDVVVERFMVQEQFTQQTQIAAPDALAPPVNLEKGDVGVAVDFVAWRVQQCAFRAMPVELPFATEIQKAHFADVHDVAVGEFDGVRAEVPRLDFVFAHLDFFEVAHPADFGLVLRHGAAGSEFFDFFFA